MRSVSGWHRAARCGGAGRPWAGRSVARGGARTAGNGGQQRDAASPRGGAPARIPRTHARGRHYGGRRLCGSGRSRGGVAALGRCGARRRLHSASCFGRLAAAPRRARVVAGPAASGGGPARCGVGGATPLPGMPRPLRAVAFQLPPGERNEHHVFSTLLAHPKTLPCIRSRRAGYLQTRRPNSLGFEHCV